MNTKIDAVFFDLGNTLRILHKDPEHQNRAIQRIAELAGTDMDPQEFYKFLNYRYEGYRAWCFDTKREAPEAELWSKWLLPEWPREEILKNAMELTFQYRQADGVRLVVEDGVEVIKTLHARGYTLGIISNLITSEEVPDWLREDGLTEYFSTVELSAVCGLRKPDPEIYRLAARNVGIAPENVAYVGDNLNRDVTGAKEAGYGMNVIFITPEKLSKSPMTEANRPDVVVLRFRDVLELFPGRGQANPEAFRPQNR